MSFELVYTSARRGLRPGASGFCTVAATEGIPRALQNKLESLSGYPHTESLAGTEPPVNRSHLTFRIQRTIYHVVSRIGDAGIDYSGRTNKIAHHLALTSSEVAKFEDGPASLFTDGDFWFDHWNSDARTFPQDRQPESWPEPVEGFATWENVFDDAGWAGLLGSAIANGFKSVSVIVPNAKETMSLLNEALQLVKPEDRWKVCFSTYYSRQTSGTQCHWRFVMDGTSEARRLRARTQGMLVDPLGSASELPDDNPFVKAAREGCPEDAYSMASAKFRSGGGVPVSRLENAADDEERRVRPSIQRRRESRQQPTAVKSRSPFDVPEEEYAHVNATKTEGQRSPSKRVKRKGLLLVSALLLAVIAILVFLGFQQLS